MTKAVPKKALAKLQLYKTAKPVFENMGAVISPKTLTRKPGKFSLAKAVRKNAEYNKKTLPKKIESLTGGKFGGKLGIKKLGKLAKAVPKKGGNVSFKKITQIKNLKKPVTQKLRAMKTPMAKF